MNECITILKQIGIFMVCAKTILHFKPQQKYDKYLKLLVGIMVMVQLISPLIAFLDGKSKLVLPDQFPSLIEVKQLDMDEAATKADEILNKYTDYEIKSRLNNENVGAGSDIQIEAEIEEIVIEPVREVE